MLALKDGKRWLVQVKRLTTPIGGQVLGRTVAAARSYGADVPVIVSKSGFTAELRQKRGQFAAEGINVQLWDRDILTRRAWTTPRLDPMVVREPDRFGTRPYQEEAVQRTVGAWTEPIRQRPRCSGDRLGKTFVAGEALGGLGSSGHLCGSWRSPTPTLSSTSSNAPLADSSRLTRRRWWSMGTSDRVGSTWRTSSCSRHATLYGALARQGSRCRRSILLLSTSATILVLRHMRGCSRVSGWAPRRPVPDRPDCDALAPGRGGIGGRFEFRRW